MVRSAEAEAEQNMMKRARAEKAQDEDKPSPEKLAKKERLMHPEPSPEDPESCFEDGTQVLKRTLTAALPQMMGPDVQLEDSDDTKESGRPKENPIDEESDTCEMEFDDDYCPLGIVVSRNSLAHIAKDSEHNIAVVGAWASPLDENARMIGAWDTQCGKRRGGYFKHYTNSEYEKDVFRSQASKVCKKCRDSFTQGEVVR